MSLPQLAPELLTQIYSSLHSIFDVLNLSQTCKRLHNLLGSSRRLPTLFAAAEREYGPLPDLLRLVTWNGTDSAWGRYDQDLVAFTQNIELLKQLLHIGRVARKIENLYPSRKWGEERYLERRSLTSEEGRRVRRAVYRYWLYCEAYQNKLCTRGSRCLPRIVEERNRLLRDWKSDELFEIEDVRLLLCGIISDDLCPTYGKVEKWFRENHDFSDVRHQPYSRAFHQQTPLHLQTANWNSWPPDRHTLHTRANPLTAYLFHSYRDEQQAKLRSDIPVPQRRKVDMRGWGDDIEQYYVVESMLKLNPYQIMYLYENVTSKEGIEWYIENEVGADWFWENGQTWVDSWTAVIVRRGWDPNAVVTAIENGSAGIIGENFRDGFLGLSPDLSVAIGEDEEDVILECP